MKFHCCQGEDSTRALALVQGRGHVRVQQSSRQVGTGLGRCAIFGAILGQLIHALLALAPPVGYMHEGGEDMLSMQMQVVILVIHLYGNPTRAVSACG